MIAAERAASAVARPRFSDHPARPKTSTASPGLRDLT
jgi:hypothetical protein